MTQAKPRAHKWLHDWLPSILLIGFVLIARSSLADHYYVPSGSMEPNLQPGDHVLVNKAAYGLRIPFTKEVIAFTDAPKRGDVVIFDSPENGIRLIKRVVATAGDQVAVIRGRVFINGKALIDSDQPSIENYASKTVPLNLSHGGGPNLGPTTIPEGQVLVLGDHRGNSHDGRFFGTVPVEALYGKADAVFWRDSQPIWKEL